MSTINAVPVANSHPGARLLRREAAAAGDLGQWRLFRRRRPYSLSGRATL